MKKMFAAAVMMIGLSSFAQEKPLAENRKAERPERGNISRMERFTPEQRKQLELKKLTLALDLNASQQKEMEKIISEQSAKRESKIADRKESGNDRKQMTADERFAFQNQMLDEKIALKARIKKILSPEQFEKWEELKVRRKQEGARRFHKK